MGKGVDSSNEGISGLLAPGSIFYMVNDADRGISMMEIPFFDGIGRLMM